MRQKTDKEKKDAADLEATMAKVEAEVRGQWLQGQQRCATALGLAALAAAGQLMPAAAALAFASHRRQL